MSALKYSETIRKVLQRICADKAAFVQRAIERQSRRKVNEFECTEEAHIVTNQSHSSGSVRGFINNSGSSQPRFDH